MVDPASLAEFERLQRALKKGEPVERATSQPPELGRRWLLTRVAPGQLSGGRRSTRSSRSTSPRRRKPNPPCRRAANERAILDSVLVGIVSVGPQGIEWMNGSARRMFACELEGRGRPAHGRAGAGRPPAPLPLQRPGRRKARPRCSSASCRARWARFWVIGNVVQTEGEDGLPRLTYALLDIDRRRQAEGSEPPGPGHTFTRIIEAAPLAISLYDADTLAIEKPNQAALDLGQCLSTSC